MTGVERHAKSDWTTWSESGAAGLQQVDFRPAGETPSHLQQGCDECRALPERNGGLPQLQGTVRSRRQD